MKQFFLFCFLLTFSLTAKEVDVISSFSVTELPIESMKATKAGYQIHTVNLTNYEQLLRMPLPPEADKVLVWNYVVPASPIFQLPKEKLVYFLWEPWPIDPSYYTLFSKVYTYDDSLVDGKKFFKFYYPNMRPIRNDLLSFEQKKFCTLVASNWTQDRINIINFFETKPAGEFDLYGYAKYNSPMYRGPIPGGHTGDDKIAMLNNYRFCICFENTHHLKGYITEKIFGCFAAGCVPIYWGAPNIEEYIPKACFIDYRDFKSNEELYQYLKTISKETYDQFIANIRLYLASEKAQLLLQRTLIPSSTKPYDNPS